MIGTGFYIMEYLEGRIFREPGLEGVGVGERWEMSVFRPERAKKERPQELKGLISIGKVARCHPHPSQTPQRQHSKCGITGPRETFRVL